MLACSIPRGKRRIITLRITQGRTYVLEASDAATAQRWYEGLTTVLPRENVAALDIQRVWRGSRARVVAAKLRAERRKHEALQRIEDAERARRQAEADKAEREAEEQRRKEAEEAARVKAEAERTAREAAELAARKAAEEEERLQKQLEANMRRMRLAKLEAMKKRQADELKRKAAEEAKKAEEERKAAVAAGGAWTKAKDAKGRVYYFNAAGDTTWEKPDGFQEKKWTEHVDPGTGRKYWHCAASGETTWVKPAGVAVDEWVEKYDPRTKKPYFMNHVTGETRWSKPGDDANVGEQTLPPGWVAHRDPSGRIYYFCEASGVTQWTLPKAASAEKANEPEIPADVAEECAAYTEHINFILVQHGGEALRVDPATPGALFRAVESGVILAKLVNHVTLGLGLDERALNTNADAAGKAADAGGVGAAAEASVAAKLENHRLVINAAKAAGCNLDDTVVTAETLAKGDHRATLDIVWQLLRPVIIYFSIVV